jgi:ppGpp synthetase/RelA/SpoT-type nucleotidyltranferase
MHHTWFYVKRIFRKNNARHSNFQIKQFASIISKIKQGITPRITTIQDIGGLRIITNQLWEAEQIYYNLYKSNKHIIKSEKDKYNYIIKPKASGYRGYHIVYQYLFKKEQDNKNYGTLKCELQIRTKLQHIWASTLEMVGYITKTDIKRGFGEQNWKTL